MANSEKKNPKIYPNDIDTHFLDIDSLRETDAWKAGIPSLINLLIQEKPKEENKKNTKNTKLNIAPNTEPSTEAKEFGEEQLKELKKNPAYAVIELLKTVSENTYGSDFKERLARDIKAKKANLITKNKPIPSDLELSLYFILITLDKIWMQDPNFYNILCGLRADRDKLHVWQFLDNYAPLLGISRIHNLQFSLQEAPKLEPKPQSSPGRIDRSKFGVASPIKKGSQTPVAFFSSPHSSPREKSAGGEEERDIVAVTVAGLANNGRKDGAAIAALYAAHVTRKSRLKVR